MESQGAASPPPQQEGRKHRAVGWLDPALQGSDTGKPCPGWPGRASAVGLASTGRSQLHKARHSLKDSLRAALEVQREPG